MGFQGFAQGLVHVYNLDVGRPLDGQSALARKLLFIGTLRGHMRDLDLRYEPVLAGRPSR